MTSIRFDAPPTVGRFMKSNAFVRILAGPVGSGKTTGCIFEMLRRAIEQAPATDGLRHTRFAIVRQTLKQLKDTVLKDIVQWLEGLVSYKVSDNTVHVNFGDVRSEWLLIPLEDQEDQRRLLSMQLTGAWMSECIEMSPDIVPPLSGRCGRYPGPTLGGATWNGIIADTNMPTEGDVWHKLMELEVPADWQVFRQPGGRAQDTENLNYLLQTAETLRLPLGHPERIARGRAYYDRLARGQSVDWIRRYVDAEYGNDPTGSAVFKETFKKNFHTVRLTESDRKAGHKAALEPIYGYPLIVTQDFGRNPCSLIGQMDHKGRFLVFEELVAQDIGLELHIQTALMPALNKEEYFGRQVVVIGDPAGRQRSTSYEETSFDLLKRAGLRAYPAPTNDINRRIRSVDAMLLQQRDGGPALLLDGDRCPTLVLALQGRYRYAKRKNGQLTPLPEKLHPWSDLADCLQYGCLVVQGGMHQYLVNRIDRATMVPPQRRFTARAWT